MGNKHDEKDIKDIFLQDLKDKFVECYSVLKEKDIVIYGAGGYGKMMVMQLIDIGMRNNIIAVCDSDSGKWGNEIAGIEICGIEDVNKDKNTIIIIASQFEDEIRKSLKDYPFDIFNKPPYQKFIEEKLNMYVWKNTSINEFGFRIEWFEEYRDTLMGSEKLVLPFFEDEKSKNIILSRIEFYKTGKVDCLVKIMVAEDEKEYFDKSYYPMSDSEVYVDCGAYNGDTILSFIECIDSFKEIYAFEPDKYNFKELSKKVSNMKESNKIHIFPYATGESEGKLRFSSNATLGSCISNDGESEVLVKTLDDVIDGEVSFIKMDIEGAELAALKGAQRIIKQYRPKLAICVYHKCEDIFEIPIYLRKLVPEYKFKIRQHRDDLYDTVLYAYIN